MAYVKQLEKPMDGPVYYTIMYLIGCMLTILGGINLFQEGFFSVRMLVGGILTAAGARLYNRVLIPKYKAWQKKKKVRKAVLDEEDEQKPKK